MLPIAAVTIYIKVCAPLCLFFEDMISLCRLRFRFGFLFIQILLLEDIHQQEEHGDQQRAEDDAPEAEHGQAEDDAEDGDQGMRVG